MDCPYCQRDIYGMTGLQELMKFNRHLGKCRKNPNNMVVPKGFVIKNPVTGKGETVFPKRSQNLGDALKIRHDSGQ